MKTFRLCLLALSAVICFGCSDSPTQPTSDVNSVRTVDLSTLPTSVSSDVILELQVATAADLSDLLEAITDLPRSVVHAEGNRTAMLARLRNIEDEIARGNVQQAMHHLLNLRRWVDGCADEDDKPHGNDKLKDCEAQMMIRALIDDLMDILIDAVDTTPTVTINQGAAQADPTSASPIVFAVEFSEPVTGFTSSDVSFTGSTAGGTLAAAVTGSGELYTVSVSGMTTSGTVVASIAAAAAVDADANPTGASTSTDNTVTFNSPPPTVTINSAAGQADPTTASPINFTVTFSKPVTGFTASDIAFTGSTAGGTLVAVVSGTGPVYTVAVSGMTTSGTVVASIPAAAAVDAGSQPSAASTSTDNTVTFNVAVVPLTVTIDKAVGQPDPTTGGPVVFTVTFNRAVTGFTASDVSFAGSTAGGTLAAVVTGTGPVYTVTVSGMTTGGTVVASIPAGSAIDAGSVANTASTSTDNSVIFGAGSPTVTINQAAGQTDPSSAASITFTVQFSEAVTGFTAADIAFTGSTATGPLVAVVSGSGPLYTVTVTGMTASGTVVASIAAAAVTDSDANPSAASTSTDNTVNWIKP